MIAAVTSILDHSAGDAAALMQVAGVSKRYGDQRALAEVSFAVNTGEVLGLIGPNGAGKTTLLEAIAGLVPADAGHVLWRGNSPPLSQRRELMFYLPDGVRPWEDEYVARLLEFFAAAYGRPARITADAIGALGLAPVLRQRIVSGVWLAGLTTMVQPAAMAGPILPVPIASGKVQIGRA